MHSCKVTFTNTNVKYISILILFCEMYCGHQTCCFQKMIFDDYYAPFEEEGVYCFAHVGRSVGRSVRPPNGFRMISQECLGLGSWNFIGTLIMTGRWPLLILRSLGQGHGQGHDWGHMSPTAEHLLHLYFKFCNLDVTNSEMFICGRYRWKHDCNTNCCMVSYIEFLVSHRVFIVLLI